MRLATFWQARILSCLAGYCGSAVEDNRLVQAKPLPMRRSSTWRPLRPNGSRRFERNN